MIKELWFMMASVALGTLGQIAFKFGAMEMANQPGTTLLDKIKWPLVVGIALYGASTILYILALRRLELSFAYPLISIGYVLVLVASYFLFHESITWMRVGGVALILAGITLVAKS